MLVLQMTSHLTGKMVRLLHLFCIFSLICFIWTDGNIFQTFVGATQHPLSHPPKRQVFFLLLSFFILFGCGWHVFSHEHSEYVTASQRASFLCLCSRSQTFLGSRRVKTVTKTWMGRVITATSSQVHTGLEELSLTQQQLARILSTDQTWYYQQIEIYYFMPDAV